MQEWMDARKPKRKCEKPSAKAHETQNATPELSSGQFLFSQSLFLCDKNCVDDESLL